jgi:hypothetical protein
MLCNILLNTPSDNIKSRLTPMCNKQYHEDDNVFKISVASM